MDVVIATVHPGAEWVDGTYYHLILGIIILAWIGTIALFGASVYAYLQRGSFQYLVISVVLGLLVIRSVVGMGTISGLVPMPLHHLIEHGIDFLIALLLLIVVYRQRPSYTSHISP